MIEAHELTKRYGDTTAVHSLSFTIAPGTVTGFLGPNGAGKSTTMRMIMGLVRPTSGTVTVNGKPYRQHRAPLREVGALCVDTALAPACVDRAGGSSPHPAKPLVLTRWSTWVVRETAGQSASGPMSRTSPKLASTRTPVPSMRTVVPWSPPNSICHRRCDRNICQSPAPSGCLCRPPARRRC